MTASILARNFSLLSGRPVVLIDLYMSFFRDPVGLHYGA